MRVKTISFAVFCESAPFVRTVLCRTVASEGASAIGPSAPPNALNGVRRSQMAPVICREVEESQQGVTILGQAIHAFFVFPLIFLTEQVHCCRRFRSQRGMLDIIEIRLHGRGHLLGKTVQHILHLMNPAALVLRAAKCLVQCIPEPQGAIAHRDLGGDSQAPSLEIAQQFMPALRAFPKPNLKADQFLLALRCCANDHQHAFGIVLR